MSEYFKIRPKSGTASQWQTANPVLGVREIGFEVPSGGVGKGDVKMKMGDGVTAWNSLPYALYIPDIPEQPIMLTATLSAGSTQVTITNSSIKTSSNFDFYASKFGISPTAVTVNNGSIILTFESQTEPITVGVKVS